MPVHGGKIKRYRRYNKLDHAIVPLGTSGQDPDAQVSTAIDIDAEMSWYGTFVNIHEQIVIQNQDPVLNQITKLLGISMRESEDILIRDQLTTTATAINCVYGTGGDQPTSISAQDVDIMVQTLANNDAEYLLNQIGGEDKFGTSPIQDAFLAFASTNLMADLRNVGGFILKSAYPNDKSVLKSEYGQMNGLRFLLSSQASVTPSASFLGNNVYNIIVPAVESYACIEQDMASAQLIYIPPYVNSKLALFCSLGYKYTQASTILNDAWIGNLRCIRQLGN